MSRELLGTHRPARLLTAALSPLLLAASLTAAADTTASATTADTTASATTTATTAGPAAVLYAAPDGSGSTCTVSAPCGLDGARDHVRALVPTMAGDLTVYLRGGTYRLSSPFRLGVADSGRGGHRVAYTAYPGERPVLTGAVKVSGFQPYDSARNIYRAPVPVGAQSRQLFVDGVRADRSRGYPAGVAQTGGGFTVSDPSYASFTRQDQIEVVQNNAWKQLRCPLAGITSAGSGSKLTVEPTCWANNNTAVPNLSFPFNGAGLPKLDNVSWVENAYELLNGPGQFFLDGAAGQLYYIPRAGQNLATADVELPLAQELLDISGTPGHLAPVNDTDGGASYTGAWFRNTGRPFGDLGDDVHATGVNGDSVSYTFTGTGLDVLGETNTDEGGFDLYVDGARTRSTSAYGATRLAQQVIASVGGLAKGPHTVQLVKTGGQYLTVDAFTVVPDVVAPVHDLAFTGLTFTGATWNLPGTAGYVDNQAGVLWDPVTHAPTRIPAAVQVHRGSNITFSRDEIAQTGGAGIDLADGTQGSSVIGNLIHDTSGGGVSLGEVDDYYLTDPARTTSGDTVAQNRIDHVGQEYADAVGVWVGFSRAATIAHNDIGHTPYSGMSLGWGWGYASPCGMQAAQGLANPCRHGTIYAGGNQILANHVHDVMGVLHDGGPIYTNGGQGGADASLTSVLAGNLVSGGNHTNNMLYHDEGSSNWNTHDNVVRFGGEDWLGMWTPTIHDITIHDNYSDNANTYDHGTAISFTQAAITTNGGWPAAAQAVISAAGPEAGYPPPPGPTDDDSTAIGYSGSWIASGFRGLGDLDDAVHATQVNGDSAALTFTGTGVSVIGERNSDQGQVEIILDGVSQGLVDTSAANRQVQQAIYRVQGLAPGSHTVRVVKRGGTWSTLDGFGIG